MLNSKSMRLLSSLVVCDDSCGVNSTCVSSFRRSSWIKSCGGNQAFNRKSTQNYFSFPRAPHLTAISSPKLTTLHYCVERRLDKLKALCKSRQRAKKSSIVSHNARTHSSMRRSDVAQKRSDFFSYGVAHVLEEYVVPQQPRSKSKM